MDNINPEVINNILKENRLSSEELLLALAERLEKSSIALKQYSEWITERAENDILISQEIRKYLNESRQDK